MKRKMVRIAVNDNEIIKILNEMHYAFEEDFALNEQGLPAFKKARMLNEVRQLMLMEDQVSLLDNNLLYALAEWMSPLPNGSLPHVRSEIIKILEMHYKKIPQSYIRNARFVRVLRRLAAHKEETKENRELIRRILNEWAHSRNEISYDERLNIRNKRNVVLIDPNQKTISEEATKSDLHSQLVVKPSDPVAYCHNWQLKQRARVPQVVLRDYVNRPESIHVVQTTTKQTSKRVGNMRNDRIIKSCKAFKRSQKKA